VVWDLRWPSLPATAGVGDDEERPGAPLPGRLVDPGTYIVRLSVDGRAQERRVLVREDPRVTIAPAARRQWTDALATIAALYLRSARLADGAKAAAERSGPAARDAAELAETARELQQRVGTLYANVGRVTSPPTADQRAQMEYFGTLAGSLEGRMRAR
jgi:hypothetical protein